MECVVCGVCGMWIMYSCEYTRVSRMAVFLSLQAYAISAIAHWDWPENWPDLFDHLIPALGSGEPHLVHGAMRVLSGECVLLVPIPPH